MRWRHAMPALSEGSVKSSRKIAATIGGLCLVIASVAAAAGAWTTFGTVTNIYAGFSDKSIQVFGLQNVQSCANPGIRFATADSDVEAVRAIALSAMLAGRKFRCLTDGCISSGGQSYQRGFVCEVAPP
jgi:hypothetical protein